jgi:sporulation protein YlmC with PRC-barrel domain
MRTVLFPALAALLAFPIATTLGQDRTRNTADAGTKVEVPMTIRSSQLVGMRVRNKENKDVGAIDDAVVSLGSGKIRYAALSFGGFAGLGNKLFAVPWEALTLKFAEKDRYLVFDVREDDLKNAPGFDKSNWPNVADASWAASIDKYYKIDRSQQTPSAGEKKVAGNITYDDAYRVSTIKDMDIRNEAGRDVGHIQEVVFNLKDGQIAYVALSFGSTAGLGGKLFAIPFHAFKLQHTPTDKYLVLNVSEEKLKSAPGFDTNNWPNVADREWAREIDKYYGVGTAERTGQRNP